MVGKEGSNSHGEEGREDTQEAALGEVDGALGAELGVWRKRGGDGLR